MVARPGGEHVVSAGGGVAIIEVVDEVVAMLSTQVAGWWWGGCPCPHQCWMLDVLLALVMGAVIAVIWYGGHIINTGGGVWVMATLLMLVIHQQNSLFGLQTPQTT